MNNHLISIITINYNNKNGLERTFHSIFNQTFKNFEYIVIDGDSNDGSKELIESKKKYINFYVSESDKGIYNAMNKGIKQSKGEYLLFINSGDELYNHSILENNYKDIHTEDLIYFDILQVFKDSTNIHYFPNTLSPDVFIKGTIGHSSTFIKKQLFDKTGLYDENLKIVSDWKFFIFAVIRYKCTYKKIDGILSKFHMDGISSIDQKLVRNERNKILNEYFSKHFKMYKKSKLKRKISSMNILHLNNKTKILFIKFYYKILYRFNNLIAIQKNKPLSIPIIIISFNQLFYLKQLVNFLLKRNFTNIVVLDNNSTYDPLLKYFHSLKNNKNIKIYMLKKNYGHLAFWKNLNIFNKYSKGYYVVTDADIVPMNSVPENFMKKFIQIIDNNYNINKVGFSLFLEDIPETNINKKYIMTWERQFWGDLNNKYFLASIDTTFALYRPRFKRKKAREFLKGIRMNKPYTARHGGWYIDSENLSEEQQFYSKTSNQSNSWSVNKKNELINEGYKKFHEKNLKNKE